MYHYIASLREEFSHSRKDETFTRRELEQDLA